VTDALDDRVHENITFLGEEGDALAERGDYDGALAKYETAWVLLPEPRLDWEAATWLLAAIADAQFLKCDFHGAVETLQDAMHTPNAIGNPFLHLRLGESLFEIGQQERAMDELARAYMGAGPEIFGDDDPKYFAALEKVLKPPPGKTSI
jgi:tetratricopeptide (TPR) repeat protein